MPADAPLLTVSKDAKDNAKYSSISAALKDVTKPWSTIRVLDRGVYQETITLADKARYEGLTLEAINGATLFLDPQQPSLITIRDVPRVTVSGFVCRSTADSANTGRNFITVFGDAPGVRLTKLTCRPKDYVRNIHLQGSRGTPAEPITIARCLFHPETANQPNAAIFLTGGDKDDPTGYVLIEENRINGSVQGISVFGSLSHIQITGNIVCNCRENGLQIHDLDEGSSGILIANNTVLNSPCCFRILSTNKGRLYRKDQLMVVANIFLRASGADLGTQAVDGGKFGPDGNAEVLNQLWHFHQNWRDRSGARTDLMVPLAPDDHHLRVTDLASTSPDEMKRIRPVKEQPLATGGAGPADPYLPPYAGALPPEGVEPWDWTVTWRQRDVFNPERNKP